MRIQRQQSISLIPSVQMIYYSWLDALLGTRSAFRTPQSDLDMRFGLSEWNSNKTDQRLYKITVIILIFLFRPTGFYAQSCRKVALAVLFSPTYIPTVELAQATDQQNDDLSDFKSFEPGSVTRMLQKLGWTPLKTCRQMDRVPLFNKGLNQSV